jgi:H+/Cl- antiporter ClcA
MNSHLSFPASFSLLAKWVLLLLIVSLAAGTLSAVFLTSLNWAAGFRAQHSWLLYFLPLIGLLIGLMYHYWGKSIERGNHLVLDSIHKPQDLIPFRMAPMVLIGTVATHLFGGSAGREGTALQMSAAAADQLHKPFRLGKDERAILLIAGLSAGFASVFGTPLAGAIFGIEVLLIRKIPYKAIVPALAAAYLGAYVTELWGVSHTHYTIDWVPRLGIKTLAASFLAGIAFSIAAVAFVWLTHYLSGQFKRITYAPLRPLLGGSIFVLIVIGLGNASGLSFGAGLDMSKYLGLGIPVIVDAFGQVAQQQDFALKILLTALTLGAGFKGGEVTPLFFIGATLGSALSVFLPLPLGLMAGMGFVAVFAAAAKTPLACCIMAVELFGPGCFVFAAVACITAYYVSGQKGIYTAPENKSPVHFLFGKGLW